MGTVPALIRSPAFAQLEFSVRCVSLVPVLVSCWQFVHLAFGNRFM